MKLSTDRILTTHVGSLPRPADLLAFLEAREAGQPIDGAAFAGRLAAAVEEAVAKQIAAGIDSVCDGEQSKISYTFYVRHRLAGVGTMTGAGVAGRRRPGSTAISPSIPITLSACASRVPARNGSMHRSCRAASGRSRIAIAARSKPI